MTISFKYKTVNRPDGTKVKAPMIPVHFSGKENFSTIALLDSGADISAMPRPIAEILGLDLRGKKAPAYGIGGKVDAIDTQVYITVKKGHENYNFKIPIKVILGNYDFPILLGRLGFFRYFVISFNQKKEKVTLKRVTRR